METKIIISFLLFFFTLEYSFAHNIDSLVTETILQAEKLRIDEQDYDGAIRLMKERLKIFEKDDKVEKLKLARLYHKIGVNYYYKGNMNRALSYSSIALELREKKYGSENIDVIKGYYNKGVILRKIQDLVSAKQCIEKSVTLMEDLLESGKSKDIPRLIRMYEEMYKLNFSLKDSKTALNYWDLVFEYYSNDPIKNQYKIASMTNTKGAIFFNEKKYKLAIQCYQKSIAIYSKSKNRNIELQKAIAMHNLANCKLVLNQFESSKNSYRNSVEIFKNCLSSQNNLEIFQRLGNTYTDLINLSFKTKEWEEGEKYYDLALKYTTKGWDTYYHPRVAELYRNRSKLSIGQKKYEEALEFNQKSLHALLPDFNSEDPFILVDLSAHTIKNKNSFLETIAQKAEIFDLLHEQNGPNAKYLEAAYQHYLTLDTVITQIRQSYEAQGSQFDLIEQTYPIYEKAIAVSLELFEKNENDEYLETAYHFAAKNKAMVLLAGMQEEEAKAYSSIPDELKQTEKELKRSIFQLESKIYQQADVGAEPILKDSLFTLKRDYQKLINRFETDYPDYYSLKYSFDKTIKVADLQQQLYEGDCLLEYFVGDDYVFVFTVTKEGFDYARLLKPDQFNQKLASLRKKMEHPGNLQDFFSDSYQIYKLLVKPSLEKALAQSDIKHLIFIPDGPLMQISFDVLLTEPAPDKLAYLLKKYPISYAYSNRLIFDQGNQKQASNIFAGFGLEYDDYTLADLATFVDNPMSSLPLSRALGPLEFSDDEILEISELLGGQIWINEAATRGAFLENASDYAILHLATHGVLNERYPMNSALIFTRQNDSTDYFLRAADLYGMELNAEMAVLSACNTGNGILERGEGVRSLARAFAAAGCPSLVASLWNASDASTKEILVSFYKNLEKGMTKAEAMRQAKLAYLETAPPTYQAPYYWSHLNVIGESGQIDVLSIPWWRKYWYVLVAGVVFAGALAMRQRKAMA
ncbi:MAG: CHAT domain-containing protein [Bacteroidetes bacterium]|nr:MAG: CHAT domain-containing protein [Bacteroidota bacterium]